MCYFWNNFTFHLFFQIMPSVFHFERTQYIETETDQTTFS